MIDSTTNNNKDYSYLIQPIRDLAENWNIDISKELEDYLSDLDKISFTFDGADPNKSLNFAEAALLIQGSAVIYSKKVEYLYNLLFQTLDLLVQRRKRKDNTSIMADGTDRDIQIDDEVEFLALDDILVADENIDLNENGDIDGEGSDQKLLNNNINDSNYKIALMNNAGTNDHRAILDGTINEDDNNHQDTGKQSFSQNNSNNDLKRSDFRMNDAIVSRSGAMVLRGLDFLDNENLLLRSTFNHKLVENQYIDDTNSTLNNTTIQDDQSFTLLNDGNKILDQLDQQKQQQQQQDVNNINEDDELRKQMEGGDFNNMGMGGKDDSEDDDDDNGHDGLGDFGDDQDEGKLKEINGDTNVIDGANQTNNDELPDNNKKHLKSNKTISTSKAKKSKKTIRDAWELLDPFEDSNNKSIEKPFKKGKTFTIPFNLLDSDKQKKQKKKNDEIEKKKQQQNNKSKDSLDSTSSSMSIDSIIKLPDESLSLRGCYFKELAYLYNKNIQQTRKKLKEINGIEDGEEIGQVDLELLSEDQLNNGHNNNNNTSNGFYDGNINLPPPQQQQQQQNQDDNDHIGYDGGGPRWEDGDDWGDMGLGGRDDSDDDDDILPTSATNIEQYDGPFDNGDANNQYNFDNVNIPDANSARVEHQQQFSQQPTQTYEELCRSYVEKYLESASKYVRETALSQRVNEWNNRLVPILQEQDEHPSFDIHTYGNKFLNSMKPYATNQSPDEITDFNELIDDEESNPSIQIDKNAIVSFKDITHQSPVYEVCRMFTSCLQLANNGNIEIIQPDSKDQIDQLNFHLLTLKKKHDIESLKVPSQNKNNSLLNDNDEDEDYQNELINKHIENTPTKNNKNNKKSTRKIIKTNKTVKTTKRQSKKLKNEEEEEEEIVEEISDDEKINKQDDQDENSSDDEKIKKKQKTKNDSKVTKSSKKPKSKK